MPGSRAATISSDAATSGRIVAMRVELLLRRFEPDDLDPRVLRRLGEELVDLRQIERFALGFALRGERSARPETRVSNGARIRPDSLGRQQASRSARGPPALSRPPNVSWSRSSALASIAAVMLAFSIESMGPPSSVATTFGALDHLRRAPGDLERGIVGRMDRAEQVGGRETRLVDPPEQAVGVDEIVGARRLGRGQPLDAREDPRRGKPRASRPARARGQRRREAMRKAPAPIAATTLTASSAPLLRSGGSRPFVSRRSARGRVGRIFSCKLTRLIRRQIDRAVASASASSRSAY